MTAPVALTLIIAVLAGGVIGAVLLARWALRGFPADDKTNEEIWP